LFREISSRAKRFPEKADRDGEMMAPQRRRQPESVPPEKYHPLKTMRIAGSIHPLMMLKDDIGHRPGEFDVFQNIITTGNVFLSI